MTIKRAAFLLPAAAFILGAGCQPRARAETAERWLPRIGLAVSDSMRAWCAEFVSDSTARLEPGDRATIVFAGAAPIAAVAARIGPARARECPAAFPQPRWIDYVAYDIALTEPLPPGMETPPVALIVAGTAAWTRGADGVPRADLDGDGRLEEVRRCTADEGEHFTLWSRQADGRAIRRWHEYYDWGGFTDPTCRAGENGQGEGGNG